MKKSIIRTIIGVILCFFLIFPLADPALIAYAEELKEAVGEDSAGREEGLEEQEETPSEESAETITEPILPGTPEEPEAREPELTEGEIDFDELELVSIEDEYTLICEDEDGGFSTLFYEERVAFEEEDGTFSLFDNTLEKNDSPDGEVYYENADL